MPPEAITSAEERMLIFVIEERRLAMRLACVEQVVRAVEVVPLPGAPSVVLGAIDVHGRIVPVVDARVRLGIRQREIDRGDCMILCRAGPRVVALVADAVEGVADLPGSALASVELPAGESRLVDGLARTASGLVVVQDMARFLSPDEDEAISRAMSDPLIPP
jgi:purine-binding chemotaxis protein CheW